MMTSNKEYKVRAISCSHKASQEEIYERLKTITDPLTRSWDKIEKARKIGIKVNMQRRRGDVRRFLGRRQELVDDEVLCASLRLLRERTDAHIFVIDTSNAPVAERPGSDFNMRSIFEQFDIPYVEAGNPPFERYKVPGGGTMFSEYQLSSSLAEVDAFVSIAKMKNHAFMGITLCLKNLFGLPPIPPYGRVRTYFHHVIRLSYVLPDLGLITQPCLNIIDGLTGQARREWDGEGRSSNALIAGDHVIATDACGTYLMGTDPRLDWPNPPYRRDRSPIAVAAEHGFGTVDLNEIDFDMGALEPPLAEFDSIQLDPSDQIHRLRDSACRQARFYNENRDAIVDGYAGLFIYLQDGKVIWSGSEPQQAGTVEELSGGRKDEAVWLKLVDPEEREGEKMEVYQPASGLPQEML